MMSKDTIYRQDAIDAMEQYLDKFDCIDANFLDGLKTTKKILNDLPSAQPEPTTEIQEILNYLDTTLHPIVSPDNWYVYAELHDMVSKLSSAQPLVLTCDGCKYVGTYDTDFPCSRCIRREKDYYVQE